jgi:hypothetical protein
MSVTEDEEMEEWLKENIDKGFIGKSSSPFGAPCFFIKKKDGSVRLCMDYRQLNKVAIKDRFLLPLITDLIRSLAMGKIFTPIFCLKYCEKLLYC